MRRILCLFGGVVAAGGGAPSGTERIPPVITGRPRSMGVEPEAWTAARGTFRGANLEY